MERVRIGRGGAPLVEVEIARTLWQRTRGLLGRDALEGGRGLWIEKTNSVHTFFMRFTLDLVFIDRALVVRRVYRAVAPGRLIWPVRRASSVIELPAGEIERHSLREGDRLHVDRPLP